MSFYLTATSTAIRFHVTVIPGRTYYRLFIRLSSETEALDTIDIADQTEDFTYKYGPLSPGTSYTCNVGHFATDPSDGDFVTMGPQTIVTESDQPDQPVRPSDWSWANIAAGASVPTYNGKLAPVSADEWNSFCAQINEFRAYKSMSEYAFTTLTAGTSFSAAIAREAIAAIDAISGAGTTPTQIRPLQAAFWLDLAAALNSIA